MKLPPSQKVRAFGPFATFAIVDIGGLGVHTIICPSTYQHVGVIMLIHNGMTRSTHWQVRASYDGPIPLDELSGFELMSRIISTSDPEGLVLLSGGSKSPLGIQMAGKRDDGILANLKDFIIHPSTYDKRNITKEASSDTKFRLWQGWQLDALASLEVQQLCVGKVSYIKAPRNDDLGTYQAKSSMLLCSAGHSQKYKLTCDWIDGFVVYVDEHLNILTFLSPLVFL